MSPAVVVSVGVSVAVSVGATVDESVSTGSLPPVDSTVAVTASDS